MCFINLLIDPCKMATFQEKTQCMIYPGLLRQNRMLRLIENTKPAIKEIHHHVL